MDVLITVLVIVLGAVWAFWGQIIAWFRGQSYLDYLDDEISRLKDLQEKPADAKPVPKWIPYAGFASGCIALVLATPGSVIYWPCLLIGGFAVALNAWLILRKPHNVKAGIR